MPAPDGYLALDPNGNLPWVKVEAAWGYLPNDPAAVFTTISQYVRELAIRRGRGTSVDRFECGTMQLVLNNLDGRFDPMNAGGPYYPHVIPTVRVRAFAWWGGTTYPLYDGYFDGQPAEYPLMGKNSLVKASASDAFKALTATPIPLGLPLAAASTGGRLVELFALIGGDLEARAVLSTGISSVVAVALGELDGSTYLQHAQDVEDTESGQLYCGPDGAITFRDRHWRLYNQITPLAVLGDGPGEIPYSDITPDYSDLRIINDVRFTPSGGDLIEKSDSASIAAHWPHPLERAFLTDDRLDVNSAAEYTLAKYKDPALRIGRVAIPGANNPSAIWPVALAADIGKRYTVKRRPLGPSGYTIAIDEFVEGVEIGVKPGQFTVALSLWPTDTFPGWILGDPTQSILGMTTRPGY